MKFHYLRGLLWLVWRFGWRRAWRYERARRRSEQRFHRAFDERLDGPLLRRAMWQVVDGGRGRRGLHERLGAHHLDPDQQARLLDLLVDTHLLEEPADAPVRRLTPELEERLVNAMLDAQRNRENDS